jgi:hypothetical protein
MNKEPQRARAVTQVHGEVAGMLHRPHPSRVRHRKENTRGLWNPAHLARQPGSQSRPPPEITRQPNQDEESADHMAELRKYPEIRSTEPAPSGRRLRSKPSYNSSAVHEKLCRIEANFPE